MTARPTWYETAAEALKDTIELVQPGALSFALNEDSNTLAVAPATLECDWDDEPVFSPLAMDVGRFAAIFDTPPQINWLTEPSPAMSFEGILYGEQILVYVFQRPFPDEAPVAAVSAEEGTMRLTPEGKARTDREEVERQRAGTGPVEYEEWPEDIEETNPLGIMAGFSRPGQQKSGPN